MYQEILGDGRDPFEWHIISWLWPTLKGFFGVVILTSKGFTAIKKNLCQKNDNNDNRLILILLFRTEFYLVSYLNKLLVLKLKS